MPWSPDVLVALPKVSCPLPNIGKHAPVEFLDELFIQNIGGSWHQISTGLKNLCDDARLWIELREESPDEMAAHFHHRLVSIHPFPNGNGRHARLMTDLLLENILNCSRFTWGSKDLSRTGNIRQRYIAALHAADKHNYEPLLKFVRT